MCAVSSSGVKLGCDLEVVEPRSEAFVADYFTPEEQALVARVSTVARPEIVALLWSAKESTLKALREGLRLDTRSVVVSLLEGRPDFSGWSPLRVRCIAGQNFQGWWRSEDGILQTLVADPTPSCPICLPPAEIPLNPQSVFDLGARVALKPKAVSIESQ
jgi:4'-phosphopantetheinyl transferase